MVSEMMTLSILIGILGMVIASAIGYLTLSACLQSNRFNLHEKLFLSPVAFFICILVIYILNLLAGGIILSNRFTFFIVLSGYLLLTLIFGAASIKRDVDEFRIALPGKSSSNHKIKIAVFVLVLVFSLIIALIPVSSGINLKSDAIRHIMFSNQLLNGFPFSFNVPYPEYPSGHYPNLTHTALAFFVNLLDIHILDSYVVLHLYQALLLPLAMYAVVYAVTQNFFLGLFSMVLSTTYGGHFVGLTRHSWLLNTAIERLHPSHITRMLSLVFFVCFLFLFQKIRAYPRDTRLIVFAGLILGLTGLAHTYAFSFLLLFIFIFVLTSYKKENALKLGFTLLSIGIAFAIIGYLPTIAKYFNDITSAAMNLLDNCLLESARRSKGQILILPFRFLLHFGIVGVLAIFSLFYLRNSENRTLIALLMGTVLSIFIFTLLKEVAINSFGMTLPYHPSQHKYGKSIFLVFTILSCIFLRDLFKSSNLWQQSKSWVNLALILLLTGFTIAGTITTIRAAKEFSSGKYTSKASQKANKKFRNHHHIAKILRNSAALQDVIAVPEKIGKQFAMMSGLHILYMDHPKTYSPCRKLANEILFASATKRIEFEQINDIAFNDAFMMILAEYDIQFLVLPTGKKSFYDALDVLTPVGQGTWVDDQQYLIYGVNPVQLDQVRTADDHAALEKILTTEENYQLLLGYYPILRDRFLVPKIYNFRDLEVAGLTWSEKGLWTADVNRKKLYLLDPANGSVLKVLKNPVRLPAGIAWDGTALWSLDAARKNIVRLDPENGDVLDSLSSPATEPRGLAWGQNHLWNGDYENQKIYQLSPSGKKSVSVRTTPASPVGIAWHTDALWVSTWWRGKIYKIESRQQKDAVAFFNNTYRISNIAWQKNQLWGFDRLKSAFIKFRKFQE